MSSRIVAAAAVGFALAALGVGLALWQPWRSSAPPRPGPTQAPTAVRPAAPLDVQVATPAPAVAPPIALDPGAPRTIAVPAFASDDPLKQYVADALAEDVAIELGRNGAFTTIARNSSFRYRGQTLDPGRIGRELGARYVLQGSVRNEQARVVVGLSLFDAESPQPDQAVWSGLVQRAQNEIAALPVDIVARIAEAFRMPPVPPPRALPQADAYDLVLQSRDAAARDDRTKARELAERAVRVAPGYAEAWTQLARAFAATGSSAPGADEFYGISAIERRAIEAGARAAQLGANNGLAHAANAAALVAAGRWEPALAEAERALALAPNDYDVLVTLGNVVFPRVGDSGRAVAAMRRALAVDPFAAAATLGGFGRSLFWNGDHDEAVAVLRRCVAQAPADAACRLNLVAALVVVGERDAARALVPEFLKLVPSYSITEDADMMSRRYNSSPQVEKFLNALRAASVPE